MSSPSPHPEQSITFWDTSVYPSIPHRPEESVTDIGAWIAEREATSPGSYVIAEPADAFVPPPPPYEPVELQQILLTPEVLAEHTLKTSESGRLMYLLTGIGAFTLADVLALGHEGMRAAASQDTLMRMGLQRLGSIHRLGLEAGYILPTASASPEELPKYYEDIREASPAIALPWGSYKAYFQLRIGYGRHTIGELLDDDTRRSLAELPQDIEQLDRFAYESLAPLVAAFNAAKGNA